MAIKIPNWVKKTGAIVIANVVALGGIFILANNDPKFRLAMREDMTYIFIAKDSTAIVQARRGADKEILRDTTGAVMFWDTTKHATTDADLRMKLQRYFNPDSALDTMVYCDGNIQFSIEISAYSHLSGNARGQYCIVTTPDIGTNFVLKFLRGQSEVAGEKIPEICEVIGAEAAEKQGWYPVIDTVEISDKGAIELQKRWSTDTKAVRVEYDAKAVAEVEGVK